MGSLAPQFKAAVFVACQGMFAAPVQVAYGHPGTDLELDIVSVGAVRATHMPGPMGNPRRREEELEVEVHFESYLGGGPEAQQPATERAYALLAIFEEYVRNGNNIFLGGSVRECLVVGSELEETDADDIAQGRRASIVATLRGHARY